MAELKGSKPRHAVGQQLYQRWQPAPSRAQIDLDFCAAGAGGRRHRLVPAGRGQCVAVRAEGESADTVGMPWQRNGGPVWLRQVPEHHRRVLPGRRQCAAIVAGKATAYAAPLCAFSGSPNGCWFATSHRLTVPSWLTWDGQRFIMTTTGSIQPSPFAVVQNWQEQFHAR